MDTPSVDLVTISREFGAGGSDLAELLGREIERTDRDRLAYAQRYYHHDFRDPLFYDLVINTGRVTIPDAVAIVAAHVRGVREPQR